MLLGAGRSGWLRGGGWDQRWDQLECAPALSGQFEAIFSWEGGPGGRGALSLSVGPACRATGQVSPVAGKDPPLTVFLEEKHTHSWLCSLKPLQSLVFKDLFKANNNPSFCFVCFVELKTYHLPLKS